MLLFPYTMLSLFLFESITLPFIVLGFIQFPLYGLIVGLANVRERLRSVGLGLGLVHISAVVLCLLLANQ